MHQKRKGEELLDTGLCDPARGRVAECWTQSWSLSPEQDDMEGGSRWAKAHKLGPGADSESGTMRSSRNT